jgi:hypothetical protein
MADPTKARLRPALRLGGVFGFIGGFLLAYQRSSCEFLSSLFPPPTEIMLTLSMSAMSVRFWGWSENKHEEERDFAELSQLAREGKPLYGESHQPLWVQSAAYSNSAFSQLKFSACPRSFIYTCVPPRCLLLSPSPLIRRCLPNVSFCFPLRCLFDKLTFLPISGLTLSIIPTTVRIPQSTA